MGDWRWVRLLLSIVTCLAAVGCQTVSDVSPAAPVPTTVPRVTLVVRPTVTATTPSPLLPSVPPASPTPPLIAALNPLSLPDPVCYPTPTNDLMCLGSLTNTLTEPIEQVAVRVRLHAADGAIIATATTEVAQTLIPPGTTAPYRTLFAVHPGDYTSVSALLLRAAPAQAVAERFVPLTIHDARGTWDNDRYSIRATLHNPGPADAEAVRVVATLTDDADRVLGYRVAHPAATLAAGSSVEVTITILLPRLDVLPVMQLYAEARRG